MGMFSFGNYHGPIRPNRQTGFPSLHPPIIGDVQELPLNG
jgi:hypothetical protein